jgi:hypothetical protein
MTSFGPKIAVESSFGGNMIESWPAALTGATTIAVEAATMRSARSAVRARRDLVEAACLMRVAAGETPELDGRT